MRYAVTRIGYVYRLDYIRTPRFGSAPEVLSPFHLRVVDSGSYNACRHRSSSHTQRFDRALDMLCARIVDGVRRQSTRTCFSDVVDAGLALVNGAVTHSGTVHRSALTTQPRFVHILLALCCNKVFPGC